MKPCQENEYMLKRPPREIYSNQSSLKKKIISYLKKNIYTYPCVDRVYLFGSLQDGHFGKYYSPKYDGSGNKKLGSDIDLVIIVDERFSLPSNWKEETSDIFDRYKAPALKGILGVEDGVHDISLFVYLPSKANQPPADKKNKHIGLYASPTREKALEVMLSSDNSSMIYEKKTNKE